MSVVVEYIELELQKIDLFTRVAAVGFVTCNDTQAVKRIVLSHAENTRALFEVDLRQGLLKTFDAIALAENPELRFELSLAYAQVRGMEANGIKPETLPFHLPVEAFEAGLALKNLALVELGRNDYFLTGLAAACPVLAQDLRSYAGKCGEELVRLPPACENEASYADIALQYSTILYENLAKMQCAQSPSLQYGT